MHPTLLRTLLPLACVAAAAGCANGHRAAAPGVPPVPRPPTMSPAPPALLSPSPRSAALPAQAMLQVPAQTQLPSLPNGCEVTSLSMLLTAVGHPVAKETLAAQQPTDPTPVAFDGHADKDFQGVRRWGDPERGFVGAVDSFGYGIYHRPLARLLDQVLPHHALDLTGQSFTSVLRHVADGIPVVVWDTSTFAPVDDWVTWESPDGPIRATQYEHAVLVVGYDADHIYVDNPLTGTTAQPVARTPFEAAWIQLGRQALTVRRPARPRPR